MKRILGVATAVAAIAAVPVSAATIVVTVDLKGPGASVTSSSLVATGATISPITIHDGETIDYTILFAGNESVTLTDADSFSTKLRAVAKTTLANMTQTGTLTLLGAGLTSDPATQTSSGSDTVGQSLDALTYFPSLAGPVTFTGLHYVGTVDFVDDLARAYNLPSLAIAGESITINGSAAVPEPATWAMMLMGFGGLGGLLRSRRSTMVKFA